MEIDNGGCARDFRALGMTVSLRPGTGQLPSDAGPHQLRVLPFGRDRDLELDGRRLGIGRLKIIELASFLVLHPHGVPRTEIARQLFPDSEPGHAGNHFRQVTHKFRVATGIPVIRRYPNLVALPDTVQLGSADADLEAATATPRSRDSAESLRAALGQVHGRYLEDSPLPWAEERRYRVDILEEETRLALAELLASQGRYPEAREQCEMTLSRNKYSDPAYRVLFSIERSMGTEVSCMAVYRRAAEALQEIGLTPGDARRLFLVGSVAPQIAVRTA